MKLRVFWFVLFASFDFDATALGETDCPNKCVDEKALDSALKKVKKQMKKDFRSKMLPKMFKTGDISEILMTEVNQKIQKLGTVIADMEKEVARLNKQVISLERENEILKRKVDFVIQDERNVFRNMVERLNQSCGCDVNMTFSIKPFFVEVGDVKAPSNIVVHQERNNSVMHQEKTLNMSSKGQVIKRKSKQAKNRPSVSGNITFNISPDMPKFDNVSSMIITDKGHLIRVALDDASRRGGIEVDKFVESVDYDPVSKRLFWSVKMATTNSNVLCVYSAHLDGSNKTLLLEGRWVFHLAVESKKGIIFMSDWTSDQVTAMTLTGEDYRIVKGEFNPTVSPKAIIVNPHSERLYVSFTTEIYRMKYDGSEYTPLAQGRWMKPMAFDVHSNILYFSDERNLFGLDVATGRKKLFNLLKAQINSMVFFKNKLYIAYQRRNFPVDVLNLHHNTVSHFANIQGEWFRLCIIP